MIDTTTDFKSNFNFSLLEDESKTLLEDKAIETGFFNCRTANECIDAAKNQPIPKKLFSSLIVEGELIICVADTGVGKSIYAVQIANEISKTAKVLYLDLELSDKQFQNRYSENYENEYKFNENFFRVVFKRRYEMPNNVSYEDYFIDSLKVLITRTGSTIVIIDNMTRLISTDSDKASTAKPLMDRLNDLKFDFNLTMVLLEHTKKTDPSRPIQLNDLQGSKMKANFSDAVFTIGRSVKDKNLRYVKQLKVRSSEFEFDSDNIIVYEVIKENSFLQLKFIDYGNENDHLKQLTDNDKENRYEKIIELKSHGLSNIQIGKQLGISEGAIRKQLKKTI
ncbi:MAG: AAA family ATPase [Mariniphaga sp.]|nr:AAA family ATPase [Mariniphaga sp.]